MHDTTISLTRHLIEEQHAGHSNADLRYSLWAGKLARSRSRVPDEMRETAAAGS